MTVISVCDDRTCPACTPPTRLGTFIGEQVFDCKDGQDPGGGGGGGPA